MTPAAQTAHRVCTLAGLACLTAACPTADPDGAGDGGTASGTDTGVTNGDTLADGSADDIDTTVDDTAEDTGPDDTGPDDTATDDDATTTGPITCVDNLDCNDPDAPICQDETCIPCLSADDPDAACAALDPTTPACLADQCVQCTASITTACDGNTPVCNPDTNACIPCNEHDQCPDSACKIGSSFGPSNNAEDDEGSCFDPDEVTNVPAGGNLAMLINNQPTDSEHVYILADGIYNSAITIGAGKTVALLAENPGGPVLQQSMVMSAPTLDVEEGARLFLHAVEVSTNNTTTAAITVDDARLHAQRSRIIANNGGALSTAGGAFADIENCFLSGPFNGSAVNVTSSSAAFLYSTAGSSINGPTPVIDCTTPVALTVTNSVVVKAVNMSASVCAGATVADSYVASQTATPTWFTDFDAGDFHLEAGHPIGNDAVWHDTDPVVDIDGDARVAVDGSSEIPGADLP